MIHLKALNCGYKIFGRQGVGSNFTKSDTHWKNTHFASYRGKPMHASTSSFDVLLKNDLKFNAIESYTSLVSFQSCTSLKYGGMLEINFEYVISVQDIRLPYHFFLFLHLHVHYNSKGANTLILTIV